jgi:glycerol uptake facilitator-like aquaporin
MELIGTFFFVLTFGLTVQADSSFAPLAVGAAFTVVVFLGSRISAGHCNPAITLGALLHAKIEPIEAVKFMVLQLAGAIAAGFATIWLAGDALTFTPGIGISAWQTVAVEFLFTFILVLVFLETTGGSTAAERPFASLLLGMVIFAGMTAADDISGGALNPAAALGTSIADTVAGGSSIGAVWLYLLATLGGAVAASALSRQLSLQ